jgi:neutral ceramidase
MSPLPLILPCRPLRLAAVTSWWLPWLAALLACTGGLPGPASAAEGAPVTIRAGAAREEITPDPSILNWITGKPYGKVIDPLLAQVLVLEDGRTRAAVIRWDTVDINESSRDEVRRAIGAALSIAPDCIIVHASHNHSSPWAPTYGGDYRGRERDTWWSVRHMPPQDGHSPYAEWKRRLITATVVAARRAAEMARPVSLAVARIGVGEFLYNRRRRLPAWGLAEPNAPSFLTNGRGEWIPEVLLAGSTFGPVDRALSLVLLRDAEDRPVASLYHLALHAVAIYPEDADRISADWPGAATREMAAALGGEALFLQGCAGDITPSWPRGVDATAAAAKGLAQRAATAARFRARLVPGPITAGRTTVMLPLTPEAKGRLGMDAVAAEVQTIVCGPLALVALPGEPLTDIGTQIRERSPFPQTLVLGYSNGNGVHYVGLPGEKARGGYEAGKAGAGTDECGTLLIDAATRLLNQVAGRAGVPARVLP